MSSARDVARRSALLTVVLTLGACSSSSSTSAPAASSTTAAATSSAAATAATASSGSQATPAIVAAANSWLGTLTAAQRAKALFARDDTAQKQKWSNLPTGLYSRSGVAVSELTSEQVAAFFKVMEATLSTEGYNRVVAEWTADDQLAGQGGSYGRQYYYMAIIGDPSTTDSWQWQFGGHHVTVNATVHGNDLSLTPSFIGAQPEDYTSGSTKVRPLGDISDEAFALVQSLDSTETGRAVLGTKYIDLVLGPGQDCRTIQTEGLSASAMTTAQQEALVHLMNHYAGLANAEDAAVREAQLKADLASTSFAWYGPTASGSAAYFRITGPHVVIEYSPQSMGGDATNHIHGIYRDPTNDYGGTVCS